MRHLIALSVALTVTLVGMPVLAGTQLDEALATGGNRLNSAEIADLIVGKRVTAKAGNKTFDFYYSPSNKLSARLHGGDWSGDGSYAITDGDQVCVSMLRDEGRYRCLTVVRTGDAVRKYNADGKMTFELLNSETATGL